MSKPTLERYYEYFCYNLKLDDLVEMKVYDLWSDVTDRGGIKHQFDACDNEVKEEIMETWYRIVSFQPTPAKQDEK